MPRRTLITLALLVAPAAQASTEEAWVEFRANVENACLALVPLTETQESTIEVNPFGSERFGVALIARTTEGAPPERLACIYDKTTGAAEVTAPFGDMAEPTAPADDKPAADGQ